MKTRNAWIAAALAVVLAGCKEDASATNGDGGSPVNDAGTSPANAPPIPSVATGEVAVTIRDDGNDTSFRCMRGSEASNGVRYTSTGAAELVRVSCVEVISGVETFRSATLTLYRPTLSTGSHAIGTTVSGSPNSTTHGSTLQVGLVTDGDGIQSDFNGNGGVSFSGQMSLDNLDGSITGSFTAQWERVPVVTDGVARSTAERPGAIAVAFNWPR